MKITSTRKATAADAKAIAELANEHELSIDEKSSLFSEQGALDFIAGYIDSSPAYLISLDGESGFQDRAGDHHRWRQTGAPCLARLACHRRWTGDGIIAGLRS